MAGVSVTVLGADWGESGIERWGEMTFTGIRSPWPDADALREHIWAAVQEARRHAEVARSEIQRFDRRLRGEPGA
jgi:hypothetical protein